MSNVVRLNNITKLNLDADVVLEAAIGKLTGVVIMGYDHKGERYFASSYADGGEVLWLAEKMKRDLMEISE
jgi:hypothetical protein